MRPFTQTSLYSLESGNLDGSGSGLTLSQWKCSPRPAISTGRARYEAEMIVVAASFGGRIASPGGYPELETLLPVSERHITRSM